MNSVPPSDDTVSVTIYTIHLSTSFATCSSLPSLRPRRNLPRGISELAGLVGVSVFGSPCRGLTLVLLEPPADVFADMFFPKWIVVGYLL